MRAAFRSLLGLSFSSASTDLTLFDLAISDLAIKLLSGSILSNGQRATGEERLKRFRVETESKPSDFSRSTKVAQKRLILERKSVLNLSHNWRVKLYF